MDLNQCTFSGNLGRDPEIRRTGDGKPIANFSIAVDGSYKDRDGNRKEQTTWVNVVCFGGIADVVEKYLLKGRKCLISGELRVRKYTDRDGNEKSATEVHVNPFAGGRLVLLPYGDGQPQQNNIKPAQNTAQSAPKQQDMSSQMETPPFDDEIPF